MATRLVPILYQAIDSNGDPINGAKLYYYATGTTTPKDTYSDEALSVANANPVICNSDGRPANGSGDPINIFGVSKEDYKVVLKDASDNTIETKDPVDTISYNINSFDPRPYQHWGTTTNTADAYRIKPDPSITAYTDGIRFSMVAHIACNASCTLAVFQEGTVSTYLSALKMKKLDMTGSKIDLETNDLIANQPYDIYIDTTDAIVLNPSKPKFYNVTINEILQINKKLNMQSQTATISSDTITYIGSDLRLIGEGASADDLTTINGGVAGDEVVLRYNADTITIKSGTGNILTSSGDDIVLSAGRDNATFRYDGVNWLQTSRATSLDFKNSKVTKGYQYLPSGLLVQWGQKAINGDLIAGRLETTDTFALTYNTVIWCGTFVYSESGGFPQLVISWWNKATTTTSVIGISYSETSGVTQSGNWGLQWIAIGY